MARRKGLFDPQPGDIVRVDGDTAPWKVIGKTRKGVLTLASLHRTDRIVWAGVHEFRVSKAGAFA